jgi:uncharacterized protein
MPVDLRERIGAVQPTETALGALHPIAASDARITGGFWAQRLRINRERTIPHGWDQLNRAGNLANLRLAAGTTTGRYQALGQMFGEPFPFLDSDVYKWLEAVGWELGRGDDPSVSAAADEAIGLVAAAQREDGYLNTFVQVLAPGREYRDLAWGHELYCVGHLVQAAIAWHRSLGDDRLLEVALRAVSSVERELGPAGKAQIEGHPEIEMALVELYRTTGDRSHLELATRLLDLRGHGLLGAGRFGAAYWQDHAPVREAQSVAGHAVRQLYLDCGAVDVATELDDEQLLTAVQARWRDMIDTRMYLTGGLGSRHRDESFGDPFELPPDGAYTETCAAIASVMLAWRLLLATGDPTAADVIERTILNGVLSGMSLDGTAFFYVNPLQRRTHRVAADPGHGNRAAWYPCACCPPNLMRLLSSWEQQLATTDATGIQLQQYASAEIRTDIAGSSVRLVVDTEYPWSGSVRVTIAETGDQPWTLGLRVPGWCRSASLDGRTADGPMIRQARTWRAGDSVVLELGLPARVTEPDPRIDAVRGCVALERGPLVYCLESVDLPTEVELEQVALDPDARPEPVARPDISESAIGLVAQGVRDGDGNPIQLAAVPYFSWANRSVEAMRVWIPHDRSGPPAGDTHDAAG